MSTTQKTLKTVAVGDEVVWTHDIRSGASYYRKVTVVKATATQFTTEDGKRWKRNDGEEYGSTSYRKPHIVQDYAGNQWPRPLLTWEQADTAAVSEQDERNRKRLQREIAQWFEGRTGDLSMEQLDKIARIIAEGRHESADYYAERGFNDLSVYMRNAAPRNE